MTTYNEKTDATAAETMEAPVPTAATPANRPNSSDNGITDEEKTQPSDEITYPEGGARAWSVAIGNAGVMVCTLGFVNSFGIFQTYYEVHQLPGTNPSTIAWIGSLQAFFIFACGAIGGPLFDRYGTKVIRPAAALYVLGLFMTSLCKEFWQFLLAQGVLTGVACGLLMTPAMSATPQYFNKKRGGAMGMAVAGSSIGGVVFPIALSRMFENSSLGFGWSVRICAFIVLAILAFAAVVVKPRLPPRKNKFFMPEAFLEPQFAFLCVTTFLLFLGQFTPFFFLPVYAISQGMSEGLALYLIAILNAASFPGRVIPAILSDKLGRMNMLFASSISTGILALCWQATHSNTAIIVWAVFYGFCSGSIVTGISVGLASCPKDAKNIGTYMGMGLAVASVAGLIGPPVCGAIYAHYGEFSRVSILSGVFCLAGGVFVIPAKLYGGHSLLSLN